MKKTYIHPQTIILAMHPCVHLLAGSGEQVDPVAGINPNGDYSVQNADCAASRSSYWED